MKRSMMVSRVFSSSSVSLGRLGADGWGERGDLSVEESPASSTAAVSANKVPVIGALRRKARTLSPCRVYSCRRAGSMTNDEESRSGRGAERDGRRLPARVDREQDAGAGELNGRGDG